MNYDQFRTIWHEALGEAGLLPFPPWPSEAVDLRWTSLTYSIGVSLRGVDSVACPVPRRKEAWNRLAEDLPDAALQRITHGVVSLEEVPQYAQDMLSSKTHGRIVVDPNA